MLLGELGRAAWGLPARTFAGVFNPASPFPILPSNSYTADLKMVHFGVLTISLPFKDSGLGCSEICIRSVTARTLDWPGFMFWS